MSRYGIAILMCYLPCLYLIHVIKLLQFINDYTIWKDNKFVTYFQGYCAIFLAILYLYKRLIVELFYYKFMFWDFAFDECDTVPQITKVGYGRKWKYQVQTHHLLQSGLVAFLIPNIYYVSVAYQRLRNWILRR